MAGRGSGSEEANSGWPATYAVVTSLHPHHTFPMHGPQHSTRLTRRKERMTEQSKERPKRKETAREKERIKKASAERTRRLSQTEDPVPDRKDRNPMAAACDVKRSPFCFTKDICL
ncbi:unnamed protein product [Arctogadus glacialis]